jgi:hypothetical protein
LALALFIYAISGAELDVAGEFRPLGIPLKLKRADLIGHGLMIASVYALRFATVSWLWFWVSPRSRFGVVSDEGDRPGGALQAWTLTTPKFSQKI